MKLMQKILVCLMVTMVAMFGLTGCLERDKAPTLTLEGTETVELTFGESYEEPGFVATDFKGNNIADAVEVEVPDMEGVGDYKVKYSLTSNEITVTAERLVQIRHKVPNLEDEESAAAYYNKGIPILIYHNVYNPDNPPSNLHANYISTTDLESHLQYLVDEGYYFPTWQEIRDFVDCKIDLPEKSIVLSFDDASRDWITNGIPVLESYDIRATSFVIVSWKGEEMASYDLKNVELQSHSYDMHKAGGNIGHGGIFPALSYEDAMADLEKSKEIIGNNDAFAYPFGDYTDQCMQIIEDAGFLCAVTTVNGKIHPGDNPYELNRVRINLGTDLETFKSLIK